MSVLLKTSRHNSAVKEAKRHKKSLKAGEKTS
jgi:hypothetical protein